MYYSKKINDWLIVKSKLVTLLLLDFAGVDFINELLGR